MRIHRALLCVLFLAVGGILLAQSPYATVVYAEGRQFTIIRAGKPAVYSAEGANAIGLAIQRGDIVQTSAGTFLEIAIHPISASIQLAENTSFRCDADESGKQSKGELYYGRVRAKVSKLSGSATYKISSPSLVAGVRGTDFGCDVIYVRPSAPGGATGAAPQSPVLNRVFCFEGSVLVVPAADPELQTVLIGRGEMIETAAPAAAVAEAAAPVKLAKAPVSVEVSEFWKGREFRDSPAESRTEEPTATIVENQVLTEEERQEVEIKVKRERNHKVRLAGSVALFAVGAAVAASGYPEFQSDGMTPGVALTTTYGGVLVSSSLILLIYDLVKR
ncbi:MAG TPA: FecR domain-containing protein [Treponemataceae bacterium]|nr:FecR domain-containing protein [Treponemataceae bacterium]